MKQRKLARLNAFEKLDLRPTPLSIWLRQRTQGMRFMNKHIYRTTLVLVLGINGCTSSSGVKTEPQSPAIASVRSEVMQEPHEAPATRLFVIPNPGAVADPWAFLQAMDKTDSFNVIDEDGKTFAEIKSSQLHDRFPITHFSLNLMLEGASLSGEPLFIDMVNKKLFAKPKVRFISHFSDGLAAFNSGTETPCGWADEEGNIQIAAKFSTCSYFHNGIAFASYTTGTGMLKKKLSTLIDKTGSTLVPPVDAQITFIGNSRYAIVESDDRKTGAIYDAPGKRLTPLPGLKSVDFNSSAALLTVQTDFVNRYYYMAPGGDPVEFKPTADLGIRLIGKNLTMLNYREAMSAQLTPLRILKPDGGQFAQEQLIFPAGETKAYRNVVIGGRDATQFGVLREDGKWVVPPEEEGIDYFRHGWTYAGRNGKWRMIDTTGQTLFNLPAAPVKFGAGAVVTIAQTSDGKGVDYAVWNRAGKRIYGMTVNRK